LSPRLFISQLALSQRFKALTTLLQPLLKLPFFLFFFKPLKRNQRQNQEQKSDFFKLIQLRPSPSQSTSSECFKRQVSKMGIYRSEQTVLFQNNRFIKTRYNLFRGKRQ
jgi:hypothetical protein